MRTRKYLFTASGTAADQGRTEESIKDNLNGGPKYLRRYVDGISKAACVVDSVRLITEEDRVSAVEVSTYGWLRKDYKNEIKEYVQAAIEKAGEDVGSDIRLTGGMKYTATDENLPEHFYHLTERKSLDAIMKEGLGPRRGHNDWKSKKRCTYLTEDKYIVPWLGILSNMEDPVVLEVETVKLPFIEQGRLWEDRDYVPDYLYSEHRTTEAVPPEALRVMAPEEVAALGVNEKAVEQLLYVAGTNLSHWENQSHEKEVKLCMDRLKEMGVMDEKTYNDAMEEFDKKSFARGMDTIPEAKPQDIDDGLPFN